LNSQLRACTGFAWTLLAILAMTLALLAQDTKFHDAPASAANKNNPYHGQVSAAEAGGKLYASRCASCHGQDGKGTGNVPSLAKGPAQSAAEGELFWYITKGDVDNGMPSWASLPERQRWQIITFVKQLGSSSAQSKTETSKEPEAPSQTNAPLPEAPFTDFRIEQPGKVRKLTLRDLPPPYATKSANNGPDLVPRP
jgi:mono/diheme cytochrome c family protein